MKRTNWSEDHQNWILPSNLEWDAYSKWQSTDYRGEFGVLVTVQHSPDTFDFILNKGLLNERNIRVRALMKPLEELLVETPLPTGGRVSLEIKAVETSRTLWRLFGPFQRKWVTAGCYVNVGFEPIDAVPDVPTGRMAASSLTLHDFLCERHQTMNLKFHEPLEHRRDQIRQLSLEMGLVVQNNMLFLPERLCDFRNKVAVMARACLIGEDPVAAYHRFLDSGYSNFLMVEEPGFEHEKDTWITAHRPKSPDSELGFDLPSV